MDAPVRDVVGAVGVDAVGAVTDQFGLTWHPSFFPAITRYWERIDFLEMIPEALSWNQKSERNALRSLAHQIPTLVHSTQLGLTSAFPAHRKRLDAVGRFCELVSAIGFSEHLGFVRVPGIELGHFVSPPRCAATVQGLAQNIQTAKRVLGLPIALENIVSLYVPPGSMDEAEFVNACIRQSECSLLLDLHNLYCNSVNAKQDPIQLMKQLPLELVSEVHIAGGSWQWARTRTIRVDDHLHSVPRPVYQLLSWLGSHISQPIRVTLERDGHFPSFDNLMLELEIARQFLDQGRKRWVA